MTSNNPRLTPLGAPRYFTSCDAARIARNVVEDRGETPEEVLACIAKGLGFTHIALTREPQVVESGVNISKGALKTTIILTKKALELIGKQFPSILGKIGAIIEALDTIERVIDRIFDDQPTEKVDDVLEPGKCNCKPREKGAENGNR